MSSHQQMPRKAACHRPYHRRPSRLQGRLPPSERSPQPRRECSRRPQQVRNRPSQLRHGEAPGRACRHLMRGARRPPFGGGGGWQAGSGCNVRTASCCDNGSPARFTLATPRTVHGGASASIEGGSPAGVAGGWDVHALPPASLYISRSAPFAWPHGSAKVGVPV